MIATLITTTLLLLLFLLPWDSNQGIPPPPLPLRSQCLSLSYICISLNVPSCSRWHNHSLQDPIVEPKCQGPGLADSLGGIMTSRTTFLRDPEESWGWGGLRQAGGGGIKKRMWEIKKWRHSWTLIVCGHKKKRKQTADGVKSTHWKAEREGVGGGWPPGLMWWDVSRLHGSCWLSCAYQTAAATISKLHNNPGRTGWWNVPVAAPRDPIIIREEGEEINK